MNDHWKEERTSQPGQNARNQSNVSWANFSLSNKVTSTVFLCQDETCDDDDMDDMFSVFAWSTSVGNDQFSLGSKFSAIELKTDLSTGHRRSTVQGSIGELRKHPGFAGDATRPEHNNRSHAKASDQSNDSLSGHEKAIRLPSSRQNNRHTVNPPRHDTSGVELPSRCQLRSQRRSSMPLMLTSDLDPDKTLKPTRSINHPETPGRHTKRRASMSSGMSRTNEFPKPRPVDMQLLLQSMPFVEDRELEVRCMSMPRGSSMSTSLSVEHSTKPQSSVENRDTFVTYELPSSIDRYSQPKCQSPGKKSSMLLRGSIPTASHLSYDELAPSQNDQVLKSGVRPVRRKSNDGMHRGELIEEGYSSSSYQKNRAPPSNHFSLKALSEQHARRQDSERRCSRSGRMSRRSSM